MRANSCTAICLCASLSVAVDAQTPPLFVPTSIDPARSVARINWGYGLSRVAEDVGSLSAARGYAEDQFSAFASIQASTSSTRISSATSTWVRLLEVYPPDIAPPQARAEFSVWGQLTRPAIGRASLSATWALPFAINSWPPYALTYATLPDNTVWDVAVNNGTPYAYGSRKLLPGQIAFSTITTLCGFAVDPAGQGGLYQFSLGANSDIQLLECTKWQVYPSARWLPGSPPRIEFFGVADGPAEAGTTSLDWRFRIVGQTDWPYSTSDYSVTISEDTNTAVVTFDRDILPSPGFALQYKAIPWNSCDVQGSFWSDIGTIRYPDPLIVIPPPQVAKDVEPTPSNPVVPIHNAFCTPPFCIADCDGSLVDCDFFGPQNGLPTPLPGSTATLVIWPPLPWPPVDDNPSTVFSFCSPVSNLKVRALNVKSLGARVQALNASDAVIFDESYIPPSGSPLPTFHDFSANVAGIVKIKLMRVLPSLNPQDVLVWQGLTYDGSGLPVTITSQPVGQSVTEGQSTSLSVGVTGSGPFSYVWRRSRAVVSDDGTNIQGATGPILQFTSARVSDTGTYECIISSPCGSVTTQSAVLSVAPACYPNCDGSSGLPKLSATDFTCYITKFRAGDSYANCDGSTGSPSLTAADFVCFLNAFRAGCP